MNAAAATMKRHGVGIDFIINNGQGWSGKGSVAQRLLKFGMNPAALRPFLKEQEDINGNKFIDYDTSYITVNRNGEDVDLVTNAPATLRFQDWRLIDEALIRVAKPRLRFIGDLRSAGLETVIPNGMAFTVFSYESGSDISGAQINMDGITRTEGDRPVFDIVNLPLPIIHKNWSLTTRQIMASQNGYTPLDLYTGELAARRVAEAAEELALGVLPQYVFGGGTAWGVTNFDKRMTKTLTAPTAVGWTPAVLVNEVLAMMLQSKNAYHYGPWVLYFSTNWDPYLDQDYSAAKGDYTLRRRLEEIDGLLAARSIDYLQFLPNNPFCALLIQFDSATIREVVGMDIVTLQWEAEGGMEQLFKTMCIMVPQMRSDQNNNTGIVHGSAASGGSTIPLP